MFPKDHFHSQELLIIADSVEAWAKTRRTIARRRDLRENGGRRVVERELEGFFRLCGQIEVKARHMARDAPD